MKTLTSRNKEERRQVMILWRPMYNMGFPVALCFLACCAFGEDQRPYLERHQCTIHQKKQIAIVENQVAKADIILPEQCSKSVDFAAKELKAYLDKATGADVKIIRSESYRRLPQPVRTRTSIFLGESPWTEGMTGIRFAALPRDSFVIKEVNGAIIIAGHDDPYFDTEKEISDRQRSLAFMISLNVLLA
jgi:hypothetical protein